LTNPRGRYRVVEEKKERARKREGGEGESERETRKSAERIGRIVAIILDVVRARRSLSAREGREPGNWQQQRRNRRPFGPPGGGRGFPIPPLNAVARN